MLGSLIVIVALVIAIASALSSRDRGDLITSRPYNNPYSDASAARDESFL